MLPLCEYVISYEHPVHLCPLSCFLLSYSITSSLCCLIRKAHKAALVLNAKPTPSQFGWALFTFFTTNAERVKAKKAQDYKCINISQV